MPRTENFTQETLYLLVSLLESRPELVSGEIEDDKKTLADQRKAWEEVTNALNLLTTGVMRTAKQVKKKWKDLKYRTRIKAGLKESSNSFYVPNPAKGLSLLEKKILSMIYPSYFENLPVIEKSFSLLNKEELEALTLRTQETTSENDSDNESSRLGDWENADNNKKITIINISPVKEIKSTTLETESSHPTKEISSININLAKETTSTRSEVESLHPTKEISSLNISPVIESNSNYLELESIHPVFASCNPSSINISPTKEINSTILEIKSSLEEIRSSTERVRKFRNKRRLQELENPVQNQIIETQNEMPKDIKRIKMSLVEISDNLIEIKELLKSSINNQNMLTKLLCSSLGVNMDKYKKA